MFGLPAWSIAFWFWPNDNMSALRRRRATAMTTARTLALLAAVGCARQGIPSTDARPQRLVHPEDVIVVPHRAGWLVPASPLRIENVGPPPMSPDGRRLQGQVTVAFVVNELGSVEMQTVGFLEQRGPLTYRDIACELMRGATFAWRDHAPARGLTLLSFSFESSPASTNELAARTDALSTYTPTKLAEWIERLPHCK